MQIYDNEQSKECGYGETGEVCLHCAATMLGYKDNEVETANLFKTHLDGIKWLHTGDLGYVDEDGFILGWTHEKNVDFRRWRNKI